MTKIATALFLATILAACGGSSSQAPTPATDETQTTQPPVETSEATTTAPPAADTSASGS